MNGEIVNINKTSDSPSNNTIGSLYEWMEAAVFSLLCVTLVFSFLFRIVSVDGNSMNRTLFHGDRLIITRLFYTPKRGDIIIINRYTQEPLVKRVIAVGGDTLEIIGDSQEVIVNGKVVNESSYSIGITEPIEYQNEYKAKPIPDGWLFVMGDNRENSRDSRTMSEIGFIKYEDIMGKAIFRFFTISQVGGL
ncbi:MAG TPA: signal peptidase I [Ruminococcaceae bacterium]|nr:signal peptidase I [Oscillospiraceae bacterium]